MYLPPREDRDKICYCWDR